ncbi:MAG: PepSY domain-containing protein [Gammaproteobacteria bacterium]|nr:MAG: PepSY domain-containing protein [Gammaproteobacteria bacterium]
MNPAMRAFLSRWHRWVGLMAMAFIIVVSITGIALNHTKEFGLGQTVHQPWLLALYGIDEPGVSLVQVGAGRVLHDGVDRLYRESRYLGECGGFFAGAVTVPGGWVAACGDSLWVFDPEDRLLERIGIEHGLPGAVEALGQDMDGHLGLQVAGQPWLLDLGTLAFTPVSDNRIAWAPVQVLARGAAGLPDIPAGSTLTLEQVILDLHSGRLFGRFTVLLMDLSAVAMLLLGVSGLVVWGSRRKRRQIP